MIELAELAVQTVDETGAEMTPQTINPASAMLSLDQHKSVPFSVTKRASIQSKIALVQRTIENGARSLAAELDDAAFAEAVANAKTTATVAGADALADVLNCKVVFDNDSVPRMGRALIGSPVFIQSLLGTNNVIRANEYGSSDPIRVGSIASLYGFMIFESNSSSLPNDGFLAVGMEGLAWARQRMVEFEQEEKVLAQKTDYALTHLYGVKSTAATNPRLYVFDPA